MLNMMEDIPCSRSRLRLSLFPNVPPYHRFLVPWEDYSIPPCRGLQDDSWRFPAQATTVVKEIVEHAGFKTCEGLQGTLRSLDDFVQSGFIWDNLGMPEKSIDTVDFTKLKEGVKINKFPGFLVLNRKDDLWKYFHKMQQNFGRDAFGFHPDTYRLPDQRCELIDRMKKENFKKLYICKLPNAYCGIGALVIDHPKKIPEKKKEHTRNKKIVKKEEAIIVQSYVENPYLINGYKFDFRIYVLITSVDPLRIYLYRDGLVRFATGKYSLNQKDLANNFIHLTNFTVNKNGQTPDDYPPGCEVNKWSIHALWNYFQVRGIDPKPFWEGVKDIVIKTILCGHENILKEVKANVSSFYNNFNLLGLDIFIDGEMKPRLLEVNTVPSLFVSQISLKTDKHLKSPLIAEMLNICGHHIAQAAAVRHRADIISSHLPNFDSKVLGFDRRLYVKKLTDKEVEKQQSFLKLFKNGLVKQNSNDEDRNEHNCDRSDDNDGRLDQNGNISNNNEEGNEQNGHISTNNEDTTEHNAHIYDNYEDTNEQSTENENDDVNDIEMLTKVSDCDQIEEEEGEEDEYSYCTDDTSEDMSNDKSEGSKDNNSDDSESDNKNDILSKLTPCDVRVLVHCEDELTQANEFERIFPNTSTAHYMEYFAEPNYYDLLLDSWEKRYNDNREEGRERLRVLCRDQVHLDIPASEKTQKVENRPKKVILKSGYIEPHIFKNQC